MSKILVINKSEINIEAFKNFTTNICITHGTSHMLDSVADMLPLTYYTDRAEAETDTTKLQLIPYAVLIDERERMFSYERTQKGNEKRLHGQRSVGVGGHIDAPVTPEDLEKSIYRWYADSLKREILEEVGVEVPDTDVDPCFSFMHFIYDPSNPVGQVHLGLVHQITLSDEDISKISLESHLANTSWDKVDDLIRGEKFYSLESWSQHVVAGQLNMI